MPSIEGLDPTLQAVGTLIFAIAVAVFSGWSLVFGRKKSQPEREFSFNGQLSDMGPVKELVEQTGLLFQQQVKTNITLERLAIAVEAAVAAWSEEREAADREEEIERRVAERLEQERRRPRRSSAE
jgi:hypothetical protein